MDKSRRFIGKASVLFCFCIALTVVSAMAADLPTTIQSEGMRLRLEPVADDLGIPWGMCFLSAKQLLVTERKGTVRRIDIDTGRVSRLNNVPDVLAEGARWFTGCSTIAQL